MNRGIAALGAACCVTGGTVWFVLARQRAEKARMHQGVLRDIATEELEKEAADACEGGVCELKSGRFRDPASGMVYEPGTAQPDGKQVSPLDARLA